ncbi:MAG: hypothetical protein ACYSWW_05515 [Planctomycetota bacterium]|jgi:hypothetical protein
MIQAAVRPAVIVIHPPAIRNMPQFTNTQEQLSIEQFISEAAVIESYEAWNKPEEAVKWRARVPQTEAVDE